MKKVKTSDGYSVYRIKKDRQYHLPADSTSYRNNIRDLLNTLSDLKFDSLIFFIWN